MAKKLSQALSGKPHTAPVFLDSLIRHHPTRLLSSTQKHEPKKKGKTSHFLLENRQVLCKKRGVPGLGGKTFLTFASSSTRFSPADSGPI